MPGMAFDWVRGLENFRALVTGSTTFPARLTLPSLSCSPRRRHFEVEIKPKDALDTMSCGGLCALKHKAWPSTHTHTHLHPPVCSPCPSWIEVAFDTHTQTYREHYLYTNAADYIQKSMLLLLTRFGGSTWASSLCSDLRLWGPRVPTHICNKQTTWKTFHRCCAVAILYQLMETMRYGCLFCSIVSIAKWKLNDL